MIPGLISSDHFHLLDNVPIGACVIDNNYNIIFWNRCIEVWTKIPKEQAIGVPLDQVINHFKKKKYKSRIDSILSGGPPAIFSAQLHGHLFPSRLPNKKLRILQTTVSNIPNRNDGTFWALFAIEDFTELSYRIIDVRDMQKKAIVEIEHRKSIEAELRVANEKIIQQQKTVIEEERLKVLLQMAGATAHELNQPLMILLGHLQLLELDRKEPEKLSEHIDRINLAGKRIAKIVKKIQTVKQVTTKSYNGSSEIIDIDQKEKILHIDDDNSCYKLVNTMLNKSGFKEVSQSGSLQEAKSMIQEGKYDLIILDYLLPDGDAFELLEYLQKKQLELPVIVLTGQGDEKLASKVLRYGAHDYLPKADLNRESLFKSINFALEKHYLNRDKERAMVVMGQLSTKDELTGLYNRRYFVEALNREIAGSHRYKNKMGLFMIDIDHFKKVNDTYGHTTGDLVLKRVAKIIEDTVREYDIPCRYGGEEFSIILPNTDKSGADIVCNRIRKNVAAQSFEHNSITFHVTLSAGIAFADQIMSQNEQSSDALIKMADAALYQAKSDGRNKIVFA